MKHAFVAVLILLPLLAGCGDEAGTAVNVTTPTVAAVVSPSTTPLSATATTSPAPTQSPPPTVTAEPGRVTLAAVGDVMLARSIGRRVLSGGPSVVFEGVRDVLAGADITFANLETAVSDLGAPQAKGYTFRAPPETVEALTDGGIDVLALANNHALDYGPEALLDTRDRLAAAGIVSAGAGANEVEARSPAILERNGVTFALLAYVDTAAEGSYSRTTWDATADSPGVAWATLERIREDVAAASESADVVIVSLHAGVEYSVAPRSALRSYAETAIDAGAGLVLGHHAHVLQPVEEYAGGLIAYSLGNFVFDGFPPPSNITEILLVEFEDAEIAGWETVPVSVVNGLPVLD